MSSELGIDWDKGGGLVPAIVQDASTLQVLMVGYMNRAALERTLESRRVTFFSRSKNRLWEKGETSGHTLELDRLEVDCDGDALLVLAKPMGPTCHRGTTSCFGENDAPGLGFLARLASVIDARRAAPAEESYTARLLAEGVTSIAKKVGEEGVEVAIAAASGDGRVSEEAADLVYHLLVLLAASESSLEDVADVLRKRHRAR
jgi:phosphoribosyl-ATP pyrophosphohydrolase/phosphoribosyl-AMP cyclohydrolase